MPNHEWKSRVDYLRTHAKYLRTQADEYEQAALEYELFADEVVKHHDASLQKWKDEH